MANKSLRKKLRGLFHKTTDENGSKTLPRANTANTSPGAQTAALKAMDPAARGQDSWGQNDARSGGTRNFTPPNAVLESSTTVPPNRFDHSYGTDPGVTRSEQRGSESQDSNVGLAVTTNEKVNASDTTLHYTQASPVTRETIQHDVHEIREEHIEREIHEYHEVHHVQPIVETEVLPARHFVPVEGGGLREIPAEEVGAWLSAERAKDEWK